MGVYRWRDRTVRVLFDVGRKDRIIDVDDGRLLSLYLRRIDLCITQL